MVNHCHGEQLKHSSLKFVTCEVVPSIVMQPGQKRKTFCSSKTCDSCILWTKLLPRWSLVSRRLVISGCLQDVHTGIGPSCCSLHREFDRTAAPLRRSRSTGGQILIHHRDVNLVFVNVSQFNCSHRKQVKLLHFCSVLSLSQMAGLLVHSCLLVLQSRKLWSKWVQKGIESNVSLLFFTCVMNPGKREEIAIGQYCQASFAIHTPCVLIGHLEKKTIKQQRIVQLQSLL